MAGFGALLGERLVVLLALGGAVVAGLGASSKFSGRAAMHGLSRAFASDSASVTDKRADVHSVNGLALGGATSAFCSAGRTRFDTAFEFLSYLHLIFPGPRAFARVVSKTMLQVLNELQVVPCVSVKTCRPLGLRSPFPYEI